jgi:pilus assembly protein CpaE
VIFLDIDANNATQMRTLAHFVAEEGNPPIVVTSSDLDVARMREFMRIGLTDVLPQPLVQQDVANALLRASGRRRGSMQAGDREAGRGSVISFIKGGGGVGASSLAVQSACALGREKAAPSTCLLDLDIQFGSTALQLDVEQHVSVIDLAHDLQRLDGALLHGAMLRPYERFDLLAAPSTVYPIGDLKPEAVSAILDVARREYSQIIVDLPPVWSDWALTALEASDVIVLVVQLTVPSLRLAKRQIETLQIEHIDNVPLFVVANRAVKSLFGSKDVPLKDAAKALGRAIDFTIPDDAAMRLAADTGRPLNEVRGGKSLEKKIRTMFREIARKANPASVERRRA